MAPSSPDEEALAEALTRFRDSRPRLERAGASVRRQLERIIRDAKITASVSYRVKEAASYRAKVIDKKYPDPWNDVTDKIGARIIVEKVRDVEGVHRAIKADGALPIVGKTDTRTPKKYNEFEYSGLHLDLAAPPEPDDTDPISCEVQIRTIAQDAWSVVSHKLVYKPDVELPDSAKRAIARLVALVEVFDEEVERVTERHASLVSTRRRTVLTEAAEANYPRFARNAWSPDLTARVLDVAAETIPGDQLDDYPTRLADFLDSHEAAIQGLIERYGPGSEWDADPRYVLFAQPEGLVLLERLDTAGHKLLDAWRAAGLPDDWLEPLAAQSDTTIEF